MALKSLKGCRYAMNANGAITEDIIQLAKIHNEDNILKWSTELHRVFTCLEQVTRSEHSPYNLRRADPSDTAVIKLQLLSKNVLDWCKNCINVGIAFGDTSFNKVFDIHSLQEKFEEDDRKFDLPDRVCEAEVSEPSQLAKSCSEEGSSASVTEAKVPDKSKIAEISLSISALELSADVGLKKENVEEHTIAAPVALSKKKKRHQKRRKSPEQQNSSKRIKASINDSE